MTTELTYLALTLILALVQIFLPAGARTVEFGSKWNAGPRDETPAAKKPLTGRLERAEANLFETLPLFIGAVLIAHVIGAAGPLTLWGRRSISGRASSMCPFTPLAFPMSGRWSGWSRLRDWSWSWRPCFS